MARRQQDVKAILLEMSQAADQQRMAVFDLGLQADSKLLDPWHLNRANAVQPRPFWVALRKLSPNKSIERKILYGNSKNLFRL